MRARRKWAWWHAINLTLSLCALCRYASFSGLPITHTVCSYARVGRDGWLAGPSKGGEGRRRAAPGTEGARSLSLSLCQSFLVTKISVVCGCAVHAVYSSSSVVKVVGRAGRLAARSRIRAACVERERERGRAGGECARGQASRARRVRAGPYKRHTTPIQRGDAHSVYSTVQDSTV